MNLWIAGIVCGVLAAIWVPLSVVYGLLGFVGFFAWATFYSIGKHGYKAFGNTLLVNIVGLVWGIIIVQAAGLLAPMMGQLPGLGVSALIFTIFMVAEAKYAPALFIPGVFLGAAAYFAANFDMAAALIPLLCGAVIGYLSELGTIFLSKIFDKSKMTKSIDV